jgi:hypothetical protein
MHTDQSLFGRAMFVACPRLVSEAGGVIKALALGCRSRDTETADDPLHLRVTYYVRSWRLALC